MNIFLVFTAVVITVFLIVFGGELSKNRKGIAVIVIGALLVVSLPLVVTFNKVNQKPVTGKVEVMGKNYNPPRRSGTRVRTYTPECHALIVDPLVNKPDPDTPSDWIRSVCVPESQWVEVEKGEKIVLGYDKKRHKHWGSYIDGDNAPLRSENGKFRKYCYVDEDLDTMICDTISEAEYYRKTSEKNVKDLQDPEYVKDLRERHESLRENQ